MKRGRPRKIFPQEESIAVPTVEVKKTDEEILREFVSKHGEKWVDQVLKNKI